MSQDASDKGRDWRETLFLPQTDFPMKAGLPTREPKMLERWAEIDLYARLRHDAKDREKYILHDGPPYANGHLHIGHALNKILKDIVTRSQQMMGKNAVYVPGWDCHGLPIEWKIEEKYRKKKRNKDEVPVLEFRAECRNFAEQWVDIQRTEFKRLGVEGNWANPYTTMNFAAEARIAAECLKFAMNGTLYQGSKPVMWSVVERTALAEAEVEYEEHESPTIFVRFPVDSETVESSPETGSAIKDLRGADIVIWTTTPWTIPGNRGIAFSPNISYGIYLVTQAPEDNWLGEGERIVLADALADKVMAAAKVTGFERTAEVDLSEAGGLNCDHPFRDLGFDFKVPVLPADFVTAETGTGFVHIAPGHGADDYGLYVDNKDRFAGCGTPEVPHTVREDGHYFEHVPYFGGREPKRVIDDKGRFGDANPAVIEALIKSGALIARGKLRHQYPHSWRSKKPVIFRNTPQWFIGIDKQISGDGFQGTIRELALHEIKQTKFVPPQGENRITGMIEARPDWVVSRQRAWGVPITIFVEKASGDYIPRQGFDGAQDLIQRIADAFRAEGADAWFQEGAKARFLDGLVDNPDDYEQVTDILDVWFDSGCTHAFVLEDRDDLRSPADLYLEGSDQHRGWFHSSLLESVGTRGRAPYKAVLTHGFTVDEKGRKMSKSLGNVIVPEKLVKQNGAEILRLWVASSDYSEDLRIGQEVIKTNVDAYRKLRNTLRFMLGNLAHYEPGLRVEQQDMPELERYMLHRLRELDGLVRREYDNFDFKRIFAALFNFCVVDLSNFYFDIRKDTLYCEPFSSLPRRASLTVLDELFNTLTAWLAPIMAFTMEEAWLARHPSLKDSVHLRQFPDVPESWLNADLAAKWEQLRQVRRVVTGALEVERREKNIGSSLEAAPEVFISDPALMEVFSGLSAAELFITSGAKLQAGDGPQDAFRLADVAGVAVVFKRAEGQKCARSWRITEDVGSDPDYPDLSARDANAVREFDQTKTAAE